MAFPSIVIGLALVAIGLQGYFDFGELLGVQQRSPTALIPAVIGGILVVCGLLSLNPGLRKHAMHAAATVGLVGFVGSLWRPVFVLVRDGAIDMSAVPVRLQLLTACFCLLFIVMCVNSFIQARRRRTAGL